MHCTNCGFELKDDQRFCTNCGAPVQPPVQQPVQPPVQQPQPQVQPQQQVIQPPQQQTYQQPQPQVQPQQTYQQPQPQVQPQQQVYQQPQPQRNVTNAAPGAEKPKKKGKAGLIIGIVAAAIVLVGGGIFAGVKLSGSKKPDTPKVADETVVTPDAKKPNPDAKGTGDDINKTTGNDEPGGGSTASAAGSTTVMVYMIGSNLESEGEYASQDIFEMLNAKISDNVNVVIQTGGAKRWSNPKIEDGKVQRFQIKDNNLIELENLGSLSMVENDTLSDFIRFGADTFPADQYFLILWDHGGGDPVVGYGVDELYDGIITYDELPGIFSDAGVHFNAIITDACDMCTLEVAMSVRDYTDYLVASEQSIPGMGTYYTGWLGEVNDNTVEDTCTTIAKEYKKSLDDLGKIGCISVIDTGKVDAVMSAYGAFLESMDEPSADVLEYIRNREKCGDGDFDIIDLITMASWYKTNESTKLVQAVKDATLYYDGDVKSTNGLAVYSPYNTSAYYSIARDALSSIGYDERAVGFYDRFCSLLEMAGEDYSVTGEDWYDDTMVARYLGDENGNYQVADNSGSGSSGNSGDEEGYLESENKGDHFLIPLSSDDWDIISNYYYDLYIPLDGVYYQFGTDYTLGTVNDDFDIELNKPQRWTCIGDSLIPFVAYDFISDEEGNFSESALIPATVNGDMAYLEVYCDMEHPAGIIQSFFYDDDDTLTSYVLNDDDVVQLVIYDVDGNPFDYGDSMKAKDISLTYDPIDVNDIKIIFHIKDVYGNVYSTDVLGYD